MTEISATKHKKARLSRFWTILGDVASRPSGAIGLVLVLGHIVLAIISPWLAGYDYKAMDSALILEGPSAEHWLGTDHLGRDNLSRVLQGGRVALLVTALRRQLHCFGGA